MPPTPPRRSALVGSLLLGAALITSLAGCSQGGNEVTVPPVPAAPTTASTSPAPVAEPAVTATIATGLEAPWGLDFLPDGSAVVTERDSRRVLLIRGQQHRVSRIGRLDAAAPDGEGGLLGVAVSPDFATDRALYFYLTTTRDNRIVRATLRNGRLSRAVPLLVGIPDGRIHDGGRLVFGADGYLYASTGESGDRDLAMDLGSLGGKILRITTAGKPAPGNPFDSPVWSFGHRNVQGLAFVDDQLWASEFGQDTVDELNRIEPGESYGWPAVEGTGGTSKGYVDPQLTWATDQASPSGLAYLDGHLWMGALRGSRLWRIDVDEQGLEATDPTAYLIGDFGRLRTVAAAPDGTLWVTTSNTDGRGDPAPGDDRILQVTP